LVNYVFEVLNLKVSEIVESPKKSVTSPAIDTTEERGIMVSRTVQGLQSDYSN